MIGLHLPNPFLYNERTGAAADRARLETAAVPCLAGGLRQGADIFYDVSRASRSRKDAAAAMQESDEQDLANVEATLNGDQDAYAGIVERHNVAVQKQMRNFSRDPGIIEELTQDVFVEAYVGLAKFRGDAPFRHWLSRIATLTGYKHWKKKDKDKKTVPLAEGMEPEAREPTETGNPEEAAKLLFELLELLSADDRLAMTLMYLEHLSQDEIAERMGWTRVMVAVRIYRAKQKLRKLGETEPWKGRLQWMTF